MSEKRVSADFYNRHFDFSKKANDTIKANRDESGHFWGTDKNQNTAFDMVAKAWDSLSYQGGKR